MRASDDRTAPGVGTDFPYRVPILLPPGDFWQVLAEMRAWCGDLSYAVRADFFGKRQRTMCWCFRDPFDAAAFWTRFGRRSASAATDGGGPHQPRRNRLTSQVPAIPMSSRTRGGATAAGR